MGERVLAEALTERPRIRRSHLADRLWESGMFRFAWAAAAAVLIVLNVAVFSPESVSVTSRTTTRFVELGFDPVVRAQLEKGVTPMRPTVMDYREFQQLLLAAGPVAEDATDEWRIDT
jgi:hypothetical protein